jgi:hypothetical protein
MNLEKELFVLTSFVLYQKPEIPLKVLINQVSSLYNQLAPVQLPVKDLNQFLIEIFKRKDNHSIMIKNETFCLTGNDHLKLERAEQKQEMLKLNDFVMSKLQKIISKVVKPTGNSFILKAAAIYLHKMNFGDQLSEICLNEINKILFKWSKLDSNVPSKAKKKDLILFDHWRSLKIMSKLYKFRSVKIENNYRIELKQMKSKVIIDEEIEAIDTDTYATVSNLISKPKPIAKADIFLELASALVINGSNGKYKYSKLLADLTSFIEYFPSLELPQIPENFCSTFPQRYITILNGNHYLHVIVNSGKECTFTAKIVEKSPDIIPLFEIGQSTVKMIKKFNEHHVKRNESKEKFIPLISILVLDATGMKCTSSLLGSDLKKLVAAYSNISRSFDKKIPQKLFSGIPSEYYASLSNQSYRFTCQFQNSQIVISAQEVPSDPNNIPMFTIDQNLLQFFISNDENEEMIEELSQVNLSCNEATILEVSNETNQKLKSYYMVI